MGQPGRTAGTGYRTGPLRSAARMGRAAGLALLLTWDRRRAAGLLAAACVDVLLRRHHYLAAEDADDGAVLLVADRLDVDDASIRLRRGRRFVQHGCLAVN